MNKKRILVIGAEVKPVPSVKGGAVELLLDYLIQENKINQFANLTIVSPYDEKAKIESKAYNNTSFLYIKTNKIIDNIIYIINLLSRKFFNTNFRNYYISKIVKTINLNNYDLILIENRPLFGEVIRKKYTGPLFLHLHNDSIEQCLKLDNNAFTNYTKIITVSNYLKEKLHSYGYNNTVTIYNGVDLDRFISLKRYNGGTKRIIYSGRIAKEKGVIELINSFSKIKDSNISLDIIGEFDTNSEDISLYSKLIKEKASEDKRINLIGYVPYNQIHSYYEGAYLGVLPTIVNEALSLSAIEMIASGIPIIHSGKGGLNESVPKQYGAIINNNDFELSLLSILEDLISNEDKRNSIVPPKEINIQFTKKFYVQSLIKELL